MSVVLTRRPRTHPLPGVPADRQRHARWMAYLGCAGAFGYGGMKVAWALGSRIGVRPSFRLAPAGLSLSAGQRFFEYWGTPILAGLAIVILLGLIHRRGNKRILRPLLRTLAWAGSLMVVVGVGGLIQIIRYYAGDRGIGQGDLDAGTYLFTYICFLMLGAGFGGTAWLTRRRASSSAPRALSTPT